jgi:hypothetical protein
VLLLKVSQYTERSRRERKCQFEADVTTILRTTKLPNWSSEPNLSHAENSTHDTKAEGYEGCDSWGKLRSVHVDAWVIAGHATLIEDVLGEGDAYFGLVEIQLQVFRI